MQEEKSIRLQIYGLSNKILEVSFDQRIENYVQTHYINNIISNIKQYFASLLALNTSHLFVLNKVS